MTLDIADQEESDLPLDVTVTVSYRRSRRRRYEEKYRLDAVMYAQHSFSTQSDSPFGQLTAIRQELRKLTGSLRGKNALVEIRQELQAITTELQKRNADDATSRN